MTSTQATILWVYVAIIAVWPIRHLVLTFVFRKLDILTAHSPRFAAPDPPPVTAIIPAKDEEATLADCLASVCAQTYPNLEILVVDDRSSDRTAAIAQDFAARDPRIRLISIHELPAGWTGKTHALQVAADQARGEWYWFLDADTRHTPDSLSIMMEYARAEGAALASLLPEMRCESFWEAVVQPLAGVVLMQSFPLFMVHSTRSSKAFANGQYILVDRSAYEAAGGHRAVRDRFVEDIYMARRVKELGLPIRVAVSLEISSTRMYTSLEKLVRGWSRILYDAGGRRLWPLLAKGLDPLIFSQSSHVALVAALVMLAAGVPGGPFPSWLLGLSVVHHILIASVLYRLYRLQIAKPRFAVWFPLAGLIIDWILYRAILMRLTGRVTWRGTAYGPSEGEGSQLSAVGDQPSRVSPQRSAVADQPEVV